MGHTLNIGCHLSASKGFLHMGKEALSIGANTFQFFTRNPRGGQAKDIDDEDVKAFLFLAKENSIAKIVAHAPYTLNLSAEDEKKREFAFNTMKDDIRRMEKVPGNYYNFHPGCHVGQGVEKGIKLISGILNKIIFPEQTTTILLETMAGKGTEIGRTFEELKMIYDSVQLKEKVGVCLDTCHVFDGGYDISGNLDYVLEEFDKVMGLENLKAIHLNDSKNPFSSHKDRHEKIGEGSIGLEAMAKIINNSKLKGLPFILETPNELEGYKHEIKILKEMYCNE